MGRGGKMSSKRNFRRRVRSEDKGSDDSDEDYVVSNDENVVSDGSDEDYCSSLDGCASEESFDKFIEEDEEEEEEKGVVKKVVRSKARSKVQKGRSGQQKIVVKTKRKRRRVMGDDEEEDEEEDEDYKVDDDDDGEEEEEEEEVEVEDEDEVEEPDYEDEEFTPDEDDCSDAEEELMHRKKRNNMKVSKRGLQKKGLVRGRKRRRNPKVPKKPLGNKKRKNGGFRRKLQLDDDDDDDDDDNNDDDDDDDDEFVNNRPVVRERSKKKSGRRRRRYVVCLDSDFVSSGSSDCEYTISEEEKHTISEEEKHTMSEEEKQPVRETMEFSRSLRTSLRSSSLPSGTQEVGNLHQRRRRLVRKGKEKLEEPLIKKGKEKVEEVKTEVVKQVCGICLSEEDKRRLRGTLDCCSHYFCFACIMEWSKVESRCPLCKQRFKTIIKPARSAAGIDLREVEIPVPERDQVYQPTEEELRSYLDPYESVICTECHEGGDDGLMLLCDICDSPAHTYCVGLGREVPEGNWYCNDCSRPSAMVSSSSQAQDHLPDQRIRSNNMSNRPPPLVNIREGLDLNSMSSPCTPFPQGFGNLSSPRFPVGSSPAASPVTGAGAPTLSGRRWIHRHIQQLISSNRNSMASRTDGMSAVNSSSDFINSLNNQGRDTTSQQTRTQDTGMPYHMFLEDRLRDNPSSSSQSRDFFPSRLSFVRRQAAQDQTMTSTDRSLNGTLWPEQSGMNTIPGYEQLHPFNRSSNFGSDGSASPCTVREGIEFHMAKEQLQLMVKTHLKSLARDIDLGNTFKDIARSSTHTILAACGLEHTKSEVYYSIPPPAVCSHIELMTGGQTSLMKGCCSSCFDSFVGDVVKKIMDAKMPPTWLSLGL
ncbi:hypothetical protein ACB094_03G023300 [Castanea mollissima]